MSAANAFEGGPGGVFQFGTRRIGQGVLSAAPWLEAAWFLGVPVVFIWTSPGPSGLIRAVSDPPGQKIRTQWAARNY